MSKKKDEALRALVARYENKPSEERIFLSQEEFDELLNHYYNRHDYDQTLRVADLAVEQHAYCPEFYKWKALIHKINLEEGKAFDALDKLNIYAPNDEEALMLRLEILVHFNRTQQARDVLATLYGRVHSAPKLSLLAFFDGLILMQEMKFQESFSALCHAVRQDPQQEPALEELLNASELFPFRAQLRPFFKRLLDKHPFNDLLWYYSGLDRDDAGDDLGALDAFDNARSLNPTNPGYSLEYADKLFDLNRFPAALKAYAAYFNSGKAEDTYETHMRVGRSYQMIDELELAKRHYFRAAELRGEMYDTFQYLGECFAAQGKWGVAAYNYGRAVERVGHTQECWLGLALCLAATNEMDDAANAFEKAIGMNDRYSDAIISYAIFLVDVGEENRALTLVNAALDRYEDASLLYGAIAVHLMANRRKSALELLNTALSEYYDSFDMLLSFFPDLESDREVRAMVNLYRP